MTVAAPHQPVLLTDVLALLAPAGGRYLDCTVGAGGHTAAILDHHPENEVLGLDRDPRALAVAEGRLAEFGARVRLRQCCFADLTAALTAVGWDRADGILIDLGLSSMAIDNPEFGFSYRNDGPLDMRMGPDIPHTAADILNTWPEQELVRIFRDYGEMRNARQVARAIVQDRADQPWTRTLQLAELLERLTPRRRGARRTPPAAQCFMALRICVNDELGQLERGLDAAIEALAPGGRLAVISFHSLEDRIVKRCFKYEAATSIPRPELPLGYEEKQARLEVLTKRPVVAGESEIAANSRAASAKLRVARRLPTA